jgi:hypothetical protein
MTRERSKHDVALNTIPTYPSSINFRSSEGVLISGGSVAADSFWSSFVRGACGGGGRMRKSEERPWEKRKTVFKKVLRRIVR